MAESASKKPWRPRGTLLAVSETTDERRSRESRELQEDKGPYIEFVVHTTLFRGKVVSQTCWDTMEDEEVSRSAGALITTTSVVTSMLSAGYELKREIMSAYTCPATTRSTAHEVYERYAFTNKSLL